MEYRAKTLLLIASVALWAAPSTAFAQFGNRLRQMAAPPQNNGAWQYATYEGELHFEHGVDPVCTALTNGVYKVYFAARSGPGGVEAYMAGEMIMHSYIKGSDRNHLSVTYLGDSAPSGTMHLQPLGSGFLGTVHSKTLVSEIYGACTASASEFKVSRTNGDALATFQNYAQQYQLDVSSEQDLAAATHGQINEAVPRLRQAFALKSQHYSANHPQMLRYYYYLARAYDEAGLYPPAAYWYQKSVAVCQQSFAANDACHPLTLLRLGVSLQANGNIRDAEPNIRQAIQASDRVFGPNAPVSWRGYSSLAHVLISTGRFAEVEPVLTQALALAKQDHNADISVAIVKFMTALLYRQTGQFKQAEDALRESIALVEKVQGNEGSSTIAPRLALASIMSLTGRSAAAEPIARNALEAQVKQFGVERPDHPLLSGARVSLAKIEIDLGKNREAEDLLRRALESEKRFLGPSHPSVAVAEMTLAKLLRTTGREQEAATLLQQAYGIAHLTDNQGIRWRVPAEFMELYASGQMANPTLAVYYGKEAVNDLQSLRSNLSRSSSGTLESFSNAAEVKGIYKTLAHVLFQNGRIAEAEQVLALLSVQEMDQFTGRSMLADAGTRGLARSAESQSQPQSQPQSQGQSHGQPQAYLQAPAPSPLGELPYTKAEQSLDQVSGKEIEVGEQLEALKQAKFAQGDDFPADDEKKLAALQKQYESYTNSFLAAQAKMPKQAEQEATNFSTAFKGTVQRLGHGAVAVQYFLSEDGVDIDLTTAKGAPIHKFKAVKLATMNQMIQNFRAKLGDAHQDPMPLARQLYDLLIGPIAGDLAQANAKTLMLSLHDQLRYVPFAALNDGKGYLIESMAVVNINPTTMDKLAIEPRSEPWTAYGLGVTKRGKTKSGLTYEALTYAGEELQDVKATLGGKSKIFEDEQFTKSNLQSGLGLYAVVHIASHFEFTPGSIDDSVLLLGDGTTLSLAEIRGALDFTNVELLTLSACQTAVGDDQAAADGSEVEGLGNIAQQKGAMAVIATLWPVADESTALFMKALYQAHQVDNLDKADSLRQAQLSLLKAGARFAHPFYWAPFILMGNWR